MQVDTHHRLQTLQVTVADGSAHVADHRVAIDIDARVEEQDGGPLECCKVSIQCYVRALRLCSCESPVNFLDVITAYDCSVAYPCSIWI